MVRSMTLALVVAISTGSARGQELIEPTAHELAMIGQTQSLLHRSISTKPLRKEMPVGSFLEIIRKQLATDSGAITIDTNAFGATTLATPIAWSPRQDRASVGTVIGFAFGQANVKWDYRIDGGRITLTTPERAAFTMAYDLSGLISKPYDLRGLVTPDVGGPNDAEFRRADDAKRAALLLKQMMTVLELPKAAGPETVEVRNGMRLLLHATGLRHVEYAQTLRSFERLGDLAVRLVCKLYEVDEAFYAKLKNAKGLSVEEIERRFLEGKQDDALYKMVAKQKPIQIGAEPLVNNGATAVVLARQKVHQCLPDRAQVRKGDNAPQVFVTGLSFRGAVSVSPDRRSIRVHLTENAIDLEDIQRTKIVTDRGLRIVEDPKTGKQEILPPVEVVAEEPILKERTLTRILDIPDGSTLLIAVDHRPPGLAAQKRAYVLSLAARIVMQEEEQRLLAGAMEEAIPALVADVMTNPRLKTTRDYCGTPGAQRFALVNSEMWTWPKDFQPMIKGVELTTPTTKGKRLLGIRIDQHQWANDGLSMNVTLVNTGGSDNGAAPGGCTLRYTARHDDKGWRVQLMAP